MTGKCIDAAYPPANVDDWMDRYNVPAIGRYLTLPGDSRGVTRAEVDTHLRRGHTVFLFDEEGNGTNWRGGYAAGLADGRRTAANAQRIGWLHVVFSATDSDVGPADLVLFGLHLHGYNDGAGRQGRAAYAGKLALRHALDLGLVDYTMSSNASSWDHGARVPELNIQQHYSANPEIPATDGGTTLTDDFGQYPPPATAPRKDGFDMAELADLQNLIQPLVDRVTALEAQNATRHAESYNARDRFPITCEGLDNEWLWSATFDARVQIPDGATYRMLRDTGAMGPKPSDLGLVDKDGNTLPPITLTGDEAAAFRALPVKPFPA